MFIHSMMRIKCFMGCRKKKGGVGRNAPKVVKKKSIT